MQSLHTLIVVVMVITNSGSFWVSLVSLRNLGSHHVYGPEEMRWHQPSPLLPPPHPLPLCGPSCLGAGCSMSPEQTFRAWSKKCWAGSPPTWWPLALPSTRPEWELDRIFCFIKQRHLAPPPQKSPFLQTQEKPMAEPEIGEQDSQNLP